MSGIFSLIHNFRVFVVEDGKGRPPRDGKYRVISSIQSLGSCYCLGALAKKVMLQQETVSEQLSRGSLALVVVLTEKMEKTKRIKIKSRLKGGGVV